MNAHDVYFIVEQNRDAQLRSLLTLETGVAKDKLRCMLGLRRIPAERQARNRRQSSEFKSHAEIARTLG